MRVFAHRREGMFNGLSSTVELIPNGRSKDITDKKTAAGRMKMSTGHIRGVSGQMGRGCIVSGSRISERKGALMGSGEALSGRAGRNKAGRKDRSGGRQLPSPQHPYSRPEAGKSGKRPFKVAP